MPIWRGCRLFVTHQITTSETFSWTSLFRVWFNNATKLAACHKRHSSEWRDRKKKTCRKNIRFPIFLSPSRSQWITLCLGKEKQFGPWPDLEAANHLHRCNTSLHIRDMFKLLLCFYSEMSWMVVFLCVVSKFHSQPHYVDADKGSCVCALSKNTSDSCVCIRVSMCVCIVHTLRLKKQLQA